MKNRTPDEIRQLAHDDVARNFVPLFNHDLKGMDLALYQLERKKAELNKAYNAGKDHAAYNWARSHYADKDIQAEYDRGYNEEKRK